MSKTGLATLATVGNTNVLFMLTRMKINLSVASKPTCAAYASPASLAMN